MSLRTEVSRRLTPNLRRANPPKQGLPHETRRRPGGPLPFRLWFPLSVYVLSRIVAAGFLFATAGSGNRTYGDLATAWDGDWYHLIATSGYPSSLPVGADGQVVQNAWAFSPGYPMAVRGLMLLTGLDFAAVAPALSLVLGAGATVVVFVLLERVVSRYYACACVLLLCTFMASPVLQLAYAESMALLLLAGALLLLVERRYLAVAVLLLLLALTRPVVLAFIPVVIAHGISRWRGRGSDPFPDRDRGRVALLACWCVMVTGLWPVVVGVSTRDLNAWAATHEAWRATPHFAPGVGWPASFLFHFGWPAVVLLALVVVLTLGLVIRRGARAWGPELRSWVVAYPAYLLLATVPGPSVIRWILLAFPLLWPFPEAASTPSEKRFRVVLIAGMAVLGLVMQWVWVSSFLAALAPSVRYP